MKKSFVILLNLGYWTLLLLLISLIYVAAQINSSIALLDNPFLYNITVFVLIPSFIGFYVSYYFFFSLFIKKTNKSRLVIWITLFLVTTTFLTVLSISPKIQYPQNSFEISVISIFSAFIIAFNIIVGFILRSFIAWFDDLKEKDILNKKTIALELMIIKLKLDPHFLFNTINNIDVLIETEPKKASEYILKLSSILRFFLYKTADELIPLADEIKYIEEYIALQKIRTSNKQFVKYTLEGDAVGSIIAPMLFIPFIENAFKHTINKKIIDSIDIHFKITPSEIIFQCKNKIGPNFKKNKAGIGNELIENRLKLLYGKNYIITKTITDFEYDLKLELPL